MAVARSRSAHGIETRDLILATAERLFAEHGIAAVSNRQVSEAAGQANNFAVGYHFGSKAELVIAIIRRHAAPVEERRAAMLGAVEGSTDLRDWIGCLVRPTTDHLASLGSPTWYARFLAQVTTDPIFRQLMVDEAVASASMQRVVDRMFGMIPALPEEVLMERGDMMRHLIVHTCAERERALHEGTPTRRPSWDAAAAGLVDAIAGLCLAPVSPVK